MAPEPVKQWSTDDVCTWLCAIGLGSKAEEFKDNGVDGSLLSSLTKEDLMNELGLSGLQAKKVLLEIDFVDGLTCGGGDPEAVKRLTEQLAEKDAKIAALENELAALKPAPKAASAAPPPPQPSYHQAPPPPRNEHHIIRGAAGGAVKGAVGGAVVGAILGDPAAGAKAGAAGGATMGAMGGIGRRAARRRGF